MALKAVTDYSLKLKSSSVADKMIIEESLSSLFRIHNGFTHKSSVTFRQFRLQQDTLCISIGSGTVHTSGAMFQINFGNTVHFMYVMTLQTCDVIKQIEAEVINADMFPITFVLLTYVTCSCVTGNKTTTTTTKTTTSKQQGKVLMKFYLSSNLTYLLIFTV